MMLIRKTQQPSNYPSNSIHDAYSESQTDIYSCNYINNQNDFIVDKEVKIGKWVEGNIVKDIYRKVIIKNVNSNTQIQEDLSSLNYSSIWINQAKSFNQYSGNSSTSSINWYGGTSDYGLCYVNSSNVLNIKNQSTASRKYYIVLEYTK